ncbi:Fructose-2,6-bisphosphatase [Apophysomyces sp. BC1034]|nr:Fructose-2,6-bisphosphatase [Apophysomyces sp. BC1015]KAG0176280.1 Fructose-2,6-bisphosphatase [Apophysomyces sp. BC1021]KAG0186691.1 Fructose-2,6-bisphosphatase [Apophysomyces sp. BC1034]
MSFNLRIACVMVGLPARGKTYISQKVCRYLTWLGINTKVFNVGNYRRQLHGANLSHTFFDPHNPVGKQQRREAAEAALKDLIRWFNEEEGIVAIYDATNSTRDRRKYIYDELTKENVQVFFIESICQDEAVIMANIKDVKLSSPDYTNVDPDEAATDFRARIDHYKDQYETVTEQDYTYIKLINVGSQVIINMIQGYLESRIVYYLMNLHIAPRKIYMSRTAELLPYPKLQWKALEELDTGVCDGMTYEEIEEKYPEDYANRDEDKFNYRYRGGESYRDLVLRLEPIIMDLERQQNILIIGHQAILRCIYAYFMNYSHDDLPYIKIPLHNVIELTPKAYGCEEKRYKVDIEAVDTHRPKPTTVKKPVIGANGQKSSSAGASGEIVTEPMSQNLISAKLFPGTKRTGNAV